MKHLGKRVYLYASPNSDNIRWMTGALADTGLVVALERNESVVAEGVATHQPQCVFLDYSDQGPWTCDGSITRSIRKNWPHVLVIATGDAGDTNSMIAALRNGVDDFVFVNSEPESVKSAIDVLVSRRKSEQVEVRGQTLALLGARAGMGVSTLASNLAIALQDACGFAPGQVQHPAPQGVALLDLGLPARDSLLYLGQQSSFSFVEGVKNLQRLDRTLLQTALAHDSNGTAILPLPASLSEIKGISYSESVSLIRRMADFYDFLITDLGGFGLNDIVAQTVRDADKVWVVCDQSMGGIVSTAQLLRVLQERGLDIQRFRLIVNKFNPNIHLPAEDVASRLGVALGHVIPERSTALLTA
ncbi:histidine kinase, partial [Hydrogenophaga sp.]|uniref:histidine kinase n=1 Tax=Hydrogenophaga sp. TaxID=1904254 RepID=UPI0035638D6E